MKLLTIVLTLFISLNLYAEKVRLPIVSTMNEGIEKVDAEDPMFKISSITVEEVETPYVYQALEDKGTLSDVAMTLDKLIAIGKKIWKIIEDNKPVVNTDFAAAISVIPQIQGETDPVATFSMMSSWSIPKAKSFRVIYKNGFGMEVIKFDYTVMFQYNGKYEGKGNYLTGVTVFANNIEVSWGFHFDAKSSLVTVSNMGSKVDPVAAATIQIDYKSETVVRNVSSTQMFYVTGKGDIAQIQ